MRLAPSLPRRAFVVPTVLCPSLLVISAGACGTSYGADDPASSRDASAEGRPVDADSADAPAAERCPTSGPKMVAIDTPAASFCIDATEATEAEYSAFLASGPDTSKQGIECLWNQNFVPANIAFRAETADHPMPVHWCQAKAYCAWRGKRLCRHREKRPVVLGVDDLFAGSEWAIACSRAATRRYPYGLTYDPKACSGLGVDASAPVPIRSLRACEGGFEGLFDMAGNLAEWEDNCTTPPDNNADWSSSHCELRGGHYNDPQPEIFLSCDKTRGAGRGQPGFGIRCCADLAP